MKTVVIGKVVAERKEHQWPGWQNVVSEIHIRPEYAEGLQGLEGYSHIIVIHVMDNKDTVRLKVTPQCKPTSPTVGVFASRCMWRPTPIGVTTVRLLKVEGNVLTVEGLDAIDGTEVLDIKPYWPQYDSVRDCRYPEWVDSLEF